MSTPAPTTLTPAQAAIWTPPPGQSNGQAIAGTIQSPFSKAAIPDTPENRFCIAWYASQPLVKQVLYTGRDGAYLETGLNLTLAQLQANCRQIFGEADLFATSDFYGDSVYDEFRNLEAYGIASVPAFNPITGGPAATGTFSTSLSAMSCIPAAWAINALTPSVQPGTTNPIGAYQGGAPEGTPGAMYANAGGSPYNASYASGYPLVQSGATYALVKKPSTMPGDSDITIEWMLTIPAGS